jgi:hypothetical protein
MNRAKLLAATLAAASCGAPAQSPPPSPSHAVPSPSERAADVAAKLERQTVRDDAYARRTFYTWTTRDQIEALREGGPLLVREESPERGAPYYDVVLAALAASGDPIAKLLYTQAFAKSRFAWPVAWATRAGFAGETYGNELVRVTLKKDALVIAMSSTNGIVGAHDLDDRPVTLADVSRQPERIGAVYFNSDRQHRPLPRVPPPQATYREYVLCNESMIESWSVGTPDIASELADERALLDAIADTIGDPRVAKAYDVALALRSDVYLKAPMRGLDALLRLMGSTAASMPLAVAPKATFPGIGASRKPPRVVPQANGTYYSGSYATP